MDTVIHQRANHGEPSEGRLGESSVLLASRGLPAGTTVGLSRDVIMVGRHPDNDLLLDDITVSQRHAQLRRSGAGYQIVDMGSLNGTYVNRERVQTSMLVDRDEIQIGRFRFAFCAEALARRV